MGSYNVFSHGHEKVLQSAKVRELIAAFPGLDDFDRSMREACSATKRASNLERMDQVFSFLHKALSKAEKTDIEKRRQRQVEARRKPAVSEISEKKDTQMPTPTSPAPVKKLTRAEYEATMANSSQMPERPSSVSFFQSLTGGRQRIMIQTSCTSLDSLVPALAKAMNEAVVNDRSNDTEALLCAILDPALKIAIKVAGYKVESVREERVLTAGFVTPDDSALIGHAE